MILEELPTHRWERAQSSQKRRCWVFNACLCGDGRVCFPLKHQDVQSCCRVAVFTEYNYCSDLPPITLAPLWWIIREAYVTHCISVMVHHITVIPLLSVTRGGETDSEVGQQRKSDFSVPLFLSLSAGAASFSCSCFCGSATVSYW